MQFYVRLHNTILCSTRCLALRPFYLLLGGRWVLNQHKLGAPPSTWQLTGTSQKFFFLGSPDHPTSLRWWLQRQSPFSPFDGCCTDSNRTAADCRLPVPMSKSTRATCWLMIWWVVILYKYTYENIYACETGFQPTTYSFDASIIYLNVDLQVFNNIDMQQCWRLISSRSWNLLYRAQTGGESPDILKLLDVSSVLSHAVIHLHLYLYTHLLGLSVFWSLGDEQQPFGQSRPGLIRDQVKCQCKFQSFHNHFATLRSRDRGAEKHLLPAMGRKSLRVFVSFIYWK